MRKDVRGASFWLGTIAAAVAILGNLRIPHQFFFADDFGDLFELANNGPWALLTKPSLGHMCIVRNSSLYLNFLAFRMHAGAFFTGMLATHVVNVLLVFTVGRRLTRSSFLSCFAAVAFAISPQNPGTLGWYAVYGHAIATTFVLTLLLLLLDADDRRPIGTGRALAIAACALAASQSFGNGAAVAIVLPLVALLLRPRLWRNPIPALVLSLVPCAVLLAMWLMTTTQTRLNPKVPLNTFILRYSLTDWPHILPMLFHLASVGSVTMLLGSMYSLSRYPDTLVRIVTLGCLAALVVGFATGNSRDRRRLSALLLVCLASYASIAAGRATLIEMFAKGEWVSTIAKALRYYYLSQAVFALLVVALLDQVFRRGDRVNRWGRAGLAVWMGWLVAGQLLRPSLPDDYEGIRSSLVYLRGITDAEIRKAAPGSVACVPNRAVQLGNVLPGTFGVYVLYHPEDEFEGRRVYFTSSDPQELALRIPGSRARSLLVPEGECPAGSRPVPERGGADAPAKAQ
jgi:hypothetical protein